MERTICTRLFEISCSSSISEGPSPLPPAPTIQCSITYYRTWATTIYSYFLLLFVSLVISVLDPIQQFTILARSCQFQSLVILSFYKADEMELNGIGGRCWNWWTLLRWVEFIVLGSVFWRHSGSFLTTFCYPVGAKWL